MRATMAVGAALAAALLGAARAQRCADDAAGVLGSLGLDCASVVPQTRNPAPSAQRALAAACAADMAATGWPPGLWPSTLWPRLWPCLGGAWVAQAAPLASFATSP